MLSVDDFEVNSDHSYTSFGSTYECFPFPTIVWHTWQLIKISHDSREVEEALHLFVSKM